MLNKSLLNTYTSRKICMKGVMKDLGQVNYVQQLEGNIEDLLFAAL